jgi:glycosyltransferase involved in cell wall biosynthesis
MGVTLDRNTRPPVFVIPHYARSDASWDYLDATLDSVLGQVDVAWRAVVVDDASPGPVVGERLARALAADPARVFAVRRGRRGGPGASRNTGVQWAAQRGAPFVLFLDADDLAHAQRLARTRQVFASRSTVDVVYSSFTVIDENGAVVPERLLTPSIKEILDSHVRPVEGADAWIPIGVEHGYTTLTSTVSVRTALALRHPFPAARAAEDDHTWLRLLAAGGELAFLPQTEASYRIPSAGRGSASRDDNGERFYWMSALVTVEGFGRSLAIAERRGVVTASESESLRGRFLTRLALTMRREGLSELAETLSGLADTPASVEQPP